MRKLKGEAATIEAVFKEIVAEAMDDGFAFSWSGIEEMKQPHMDYPGFRVSLGVGFEKMKDKIQIDIGLGDMVEPVEDNFHPFEYKGKPIFTGEISLLMYPVETIFAEKIETIISKGASNSRMKDYHDVILMIREPDLIDAKKLKSAVTATFQNRGTALRIPVEFDEGGMAALQKLWASHINGLGAFKMKLRLPDQMTDVLTEANAWLTHNLSGK